MCAVGEHSAMKTTKMDGLQQCLNCGNKLHGSMCRALWNKWEDKQCTMTVEGLSGLERKKSKSHVALICYTCMKV